MPDVRYVILSDLHFGAENSLLTALNEIAEPCADPTKRSPVLEGFVECLANLIGRNEGSDPPTLVLAGDILELALAEDEVAIGTDHDGIMVLDDALAAGTPLAAEMLYVWTFVPGAMLVTLAEPLPLVL